MAVVKMEQAQMRRVPVGMMMKVTKWEGAVTGVRASAPCQRAKRVSSFARSESQFGFESRQHSNHPRTLHLSVKACT